MSRSFLGLTLRRGSTQDSSESELLKHNTFGLDTLVTPSLVLADIVFVHGLGGGSVSTWTRPQDPKSFWPERWLGSDPAFENVRIHTYGYDASWGKRKKNPLDVHAYGQALVEELQSHPTVSPAKTPILFVGHSMGGKCFHHSARSFMGRRSMIPVREPWWRVGHWGCSSQWL